MRIAVINRLDTRDVGVLSGATHFMIKALEARSVSVTTLGPMPSKWIERSRYLHGAARIIGRRYDWMHSSAAARELAQKFADRLSKDNYDVIFAPLASTEIAYLNTELPIVYLTDMTVALGSSYYDALKNLLPFTAGEGERIERLAIQKAARIVVPSEWAAGSFLKDYGCDAGKVQVVSYGANLSTPPTREEAIAERDIDTCRLLLLGVNWERKGGPLAFRVLQLLLDAGVKAELIVCGCQPPSDVAHPALRVIPFLKKDRPEDALQLRQLLLSSTFLILPSQAEAWGLVFGEASACGLPSVTRNTGGISSVIRQGVNGLCLPANAEPEQYAAEILGLLNNPERYRSLCLSSRDEYETRLNWDAWAQRMIDIFDQVKLSSKPDRAEATPLKS